MSVNSTNPGTWLGGTWEQIKDRFLLAAGTTYSAGSTGGSADAVVVSHTHTSNKIKTGGIVYPASIYTVNAGTATNVYAIASNNPASISIENTGVSGTGKNMPPYLTVYIWKRIA